MGESRRRGFLGEFLGEFLGIFLSGTDVQLVRRACHVDAAQGEREHVPTEVSIHVKWGPPARSRLGAISSGLGGAGILRAGKRVFLQQLLQKLISRLV